MSAWAPRQADDAAGAASGRLPRATMMVLCAVSVMMGIGYTGIQALLPTIGREIGIADSLVAWIFSLAAILVMVFSPIWARLSDVRGRKPIILVGVTGYIISMAGFAVGVSAGVWGLAPPLAIFIWLLVTRGINGGVGAASQPATQAYVADHTTPETRTQAIAIIAGANGLGTILGPLVAPLLVFEPLGLAGPLYAFAACGLAVWICAWRYLPDDRRGRGQSSGEAAGPATAPVAMRVVLGYPQLRPFLVYGAVSSLVGVGLTQTVGFVIIDQVGRSPVAALPYITLAMMVGAASAVFGQWGLAPLFRMQPGGLMKWGAGLGILGGAMMIATQHYALTVAGFGLFSLGLSLGRPGFTAGASLAVGPAEQGSAAGLIAAIGGASPLLSPLFLLLYGVASPAPFVLAAVVMAALWIYSLVDRHLSRPAGA